MILYVDPSGKGLRSHPQIGGVLADAAAEVLRRLQLPFRIADRNAGLLEIAAADMAAWAAREAHRTRKVVAGHVAFLFK